MKRRWLTQAERIAADYLLRRMSFKSRPEDWQVSTDHMDLVEGVFRDDGTLERLEWMRSGTTHVLVHIGPREEPAPASAPALVLGGRR